MTSIQLKALMAGVLLVGLIGLYLLGRWQGYDAGVTAMEIKMQKAQVEHQKRINEEAGKNAELQRRIDELQMAGPVEVVKYVRDRGTDPVCFDDAGLHILTRYRAYPGAPAE